MSLSSGWHTTNSRRSSRRPVDPGERRGDQTGAPRSLATMRDPWPQSESLGHNQRALATIREPWPQSESLGHSERTLATIREPWPIACKQLREQVRERRARRAGIVGGGWGSEVLEGPSGARSARDKCDRVIYRRPRCPRRASPSCTQPRPYEIPCAHPGTPSIICSAWVLCASWCAELEGRTKRRRTRRKTKRTRMKTRTRTKRRRTMARRQTLICSAKSEKAFLGL